LGHVIRFARHLHAEDPRHEIPAAVFGTEHFPRRPPYILTNEQIRELIEEASKSGYPTLRRQTYSTMFALLSCTGLRVSEAIRLRYKDITADGLLICQTKFQKSRLIPLHESARAGLERYLQQRRPYACHPQKPRHAPRLRGRIRDAARRGLNGHGRHTIPRGDVAN
jgi:site-specific recombinase XerD